VRGSDDRDIGDSGQDCASTTLVVVDLMEPAREREEGAGAAHCAARDIIIDGVITKTDGTGAPAAVAEAAEEEEEEAIVAGDCAVTNCSGAPFAAKCIDMGMGMGIGIGIGMCTGRCAGEAADSRSGVKGVDCEGEVETDELAVFITFVVFTTEEVLTVAATVVAVAVVMVAEEELLLEEGEDAAEAADFRADGEEEVEAEPDERLSAESTSEEGDGGSTCREQMLSIEPW
jgi:hypothetical protein